MKRTGLLAIACAAALTAACGGANNDRSDIAANNNDTVNSDTRGVGTAGDNAFSAGDRDFIEDQLEAGMAEVELGKLAAERGRSAQVKQFGQMMVTDHTKAGEELKQIAMQHNFTPAVAISDQHRDLRDRLMKLQGAEFDREYMKAMVEGHEDVVDQKESRVDDKSLGEWKTKHQDPHTHDKIEAKVEAETVIPENSDNAATMAVNQWAAKSLPVAEAHLQQAKALHDTLDQNGRNSTN